jgi:amidohydrolase
MDGLPVTEETGLPYASKVRTEYNGREVGVMHACGHDTHVAILLGAATVLSELRNELPGTVKFIFQPAEEGAPPGENGGAEIMVEEGALDNPRPEAIFGLHSVPEFEVGQVAYRAGGMMASSDRLTIRIGGRQTHGAKPWLGIDPIVVSAQIIMALQTIASRQVDVTLAPSIVTIGRVHGGVRYNIIPDEVDMLGTIRAFNADMREDIYRRVKRTVAAIAESAGATAEVTIDNGIPVTYNDAAITDRMAPTLRKVVGEGNAILTTPQTWAEDFSYYQKEIPGLYFLLGVRTAGADRSEFAPNHSPKFRVDEDALVVGVRAMAYLAIEYLQGQKPRQ